MAFAWTNLPVRRDCQLADEVPQRRPSQRAGEGGEPPSRGCAHVQTPGCPEAEPEKLTSGAVATSHTMVETGLSALERTERVSGRLFS